MLRHQLQQLRLEKQNQLLVSNSLFGQHQKELERTRIAVKEEEEEKDQQEDKKKKVSREYSQIIQSIKNIFNRCQGSMRNISKGSIANRDQWEFQLEVIHARIKDLIEIEQEYKESMQEAAFQQANGMGSSLDLRENSVSTQLTGATGGPGGSGRPAAKTPKTGKSDEGYAPQ